MLPPNSGVLYVVWGEMERTLQRSMASLRLVNPDLPVHVERLPPTATLLDKASMMDYSPFEHTLALDADTVVMRRLDFGFEKAARHALACCICECPWARRYAGIEGPMIEYNTGVLFFSRQAGPLFERWKHWTRSMDSRVSFRVGDETRTMEVNDQAGFAKAVHEMEVNPFVLPLNWNYRPRFQKIFFGPLYVWHDYSDVPAELVQWNKSPVHNERLIPMATLNL